MQEKGNLSINSENFLPIIKKWLYTDKDIFIRELVSNACDAVTKLQKLSLLGEAELAEDETFSIRVVLNQDEKTLQVIDNGIGMTADEVKKYINQIAFSGATDFLTKLTRFPSRMAHSLRNGSAKAALITKWRTAPAKHAARQLPCIWARTERNFWTNPRFTPL